MKILSYRRFALWTRELRRWLSAKFDSISIDLTPVEEKLSEVKSGVADVQDALANLPKVDFQADRELIMGGVKGVDRTLQYVLAGYLFQTAFNFSDDYITESVQESQFLKVGDVVLFEYADDDYIVTDYDKDAYERGFIWQELEADDGGIGQDITVADVERDSLWRVKEVLEDDGNNHILYIYEPVNIGVSARELQERLRSMQGTSNVANLTTIRTDIRQGLTNQQLILSKLNEIGGKISALEIATDAEIDQMTDDIINPSNNE